MAAITNEEIIAALLQHSTVRDAAQAIGISTRTIYERMQNGEFRAQYREARAEIVREAVDKTNSKLSAAIDTITEIMLDKETPIRFRLQAAQIVIDRAGKLSERLEKIDRLCAEDRNPFGIGL